MSMDINRVQEALAKMNSWWNTGFVPSHLTGSVYRNPFSELLRRLRDTTDRRAIAVIGPRQVGKTVLLHQLLLGLIHGEPKVEPKSILYAHLDHPLLIELDIEEIVKLYKSLWGTTLGQTIYLFLDEIHHSKQWDKWVKAIFDSGDPIRIVMSGSAAATLRRSGVESGLGRWDEFRLWPFNFCEYFQLRGEKPLSFERLGPNPTASVQLDPERMAFGFGLDLERLQGQLHQYVMSSGFPRIALESDYLRGQQRLREDIVERAIYRDLVPLAGLRDPVGLHRLFLRLVYQPGWILDEAKMASEMGLSRPTVNQYIKYLADAFLIRLVLPIAGKRGAGIRRRPRIYPVDAGMANAVAMRQDDVLYDADAMGRLMEVVVLNELASRYPAANLAWYRNDEGQEVDFILEEAPDRRMAVEVKYRDRIQDVDLKKLIRGMDATGSDRGLILHRGGWQPPNVDLIQGRKIACVPLAWWAYLSRQAPT